MSERNGNQRSPRGGRQEQRRRPNRPQAPDIWREPAGELPAAEPITMPREVGALLRSLGDPPIHGGTAAGHYFNAVAQRSAAVAIALALSADLLADSAAD